MASPSPFSSADHGIEKYKILVARKMTIQNNQKWLSLLTLNDRVADTDTRYGTHIKQFYQTTVLLNIEKYRVTLFVLRKKTQVALIEKKVEE